MECSAAQRLRVGVTLHPYYSWTENIVADAAEVIPILPGDLDPHSYQARPQEIKVLQSLDAIIVNGLGHDDFIEPMLEAAGQQELPRIRPGKDVPMLPVAHGADGEGGGADNSHSFLSITGAVYEIHAIAQELGELDPNNAELYRENAWTYVRRLRQLQAKAISAISDLETSGLRISTVHDGYGYLFQELGLEVDTIIQPRHGIEPSPRQLADTLNRLREARVHVLFTEMDFPPGIVQVVREETQVRLYRLTHISKGPYSAEKFETDIASNFSSILAALRDYGESRR